jgi:S1-C subfamily serine protease
MKLKHIFHLIILISSLIVVVACNIFSLPIITQTSTEVVNEEKPDQELLKTSIISNEEEIIVNLYKIINPSVVNISTYIKQNNVVIQSGQGSGFVFDGDGYIVTNSHVIHGVDDIEVYFSDSSTSHAKVLGEDLHSDLAVIKVDYLPENANPLPLGDMDDLSVGQTVVAIGNPFGLGGTLTKGIISALGRTIPTLTAFSIPQSIQTDAPINPGNSGGPLLNLRGEVIGVNAQIETDGSSRVNSGIGFAIPISIMEKVIPELIESGEYKWSWLGVTGRTLDPTLIDAMKLSIRKGAYISSVVKNGPSSNTDLRGAEKLVVINGRQVEVGGDVIIAIDDVIVNSFEDLLIYTTLNTKPGQEVTLTVLRGNKEKEIKVTVEERPSTIDFSP